MDILYACLSELGKRDINQDFNQVYIDDHIGCFLVADGCGAYEGSEIASQSLLENISTLIAKQTDALIEDPNKTFQAIVDEAAQAMIKQLDKFDYADAATTLAAVLLFDEGVLVAHVGDSRVIRFHGQTQQCWHTKDHNVFEELKAKGEVSDQDLHDHPSAHILTNVFDRHLSYHLEMTRLKALGEQHLYVLATDGVWPYLNKEDYQSLLASSQPIHVLESIFARLKTNQQDDDNMTAIVMRRV